MREAIRLYAERFPDRVHPSFCFSKHSTNFLKKREMWIIKKRKQIKKATDDGNSMNILATVALNPHINTV